MKKVIRFVGAWTVGLPCVMVLGIGFVVELAVYWLTDNDYGMEDCLMTYKVTCGDWWKWASFKEVK